MELQELITRAIEVRKKYAAFETEKYGREWNGVEITQGFVGDVGDLSKLILAKEGMREIDDVDQKLQHELSDCLWSIIVLADKYGINLESAFLETMDNLNKRLSNSK